MLESNTQKKQCEQLLQKISFLKKSVRGTQSETDHSPYFTSLTVWRRVFGGEKCYN